MVSLSQLNQRWWYRLIKVAYVLSTLTLFAIGTIVIILVHSDNAIDYGKSTIRCDDGFVLSVKDAAPNATYADLYDLQKGDTTFDGDLDSLLRWACTSANATMKDGTVRSITGPQIFDLLTSDRNDVVAINDEPLNNGDSFIPYIQPDPSHNYTISLVSVNQLPAVIGYILLWLLVVMVIFEVSRHAFYYIVLGKMFPGRH